MAFRNKRKIGERTSHHCQIEKLTNSSTKKWMCLSYSYFILARLDGLF